MPHNILSSFNDMIKILEVEEITFMVAILERSGEIPVCRDTITYSLLWRLLEDLLHPELDTVQGLFSDYL